MDRDRRLSLIVGGFVLLSLAAFGLMVVSLSSQQGIWKPRYRLVAYFDNVGGLINGAPVWLAGTQVGRVDSLSLERRPTGEPGVKVVMRIESVVQERIRGDSVAQIGTIGLLGDKYVEVSMGSEEAPMLEDGAEIESISPIDINLAMSKAAAALDEFESALPLFKNLVTNVNDVIENFGTEGAQNLTSSFAALGDIVREIRQGEGLLHSLIYDQYEGSGVESMESSLANLEDIMFEVAHGEGILHSLIYDKPTEQDVVQQALAAGARLNSILSKVDAGEGTMGLLVNDPTLYEDMKLLVGGANRSFMVRTMVNMATEDGQ